MAGERFVVTTGTGSGKSLCFFIPIVSDMPAARRTSAERRTHAIVVYPMNELANSQMDELITYIDHRWAWAKPRMVTEAVGELSENPVGRLPQGAA